VEVKAGRADLSPAQEAWRRGWRGCPVAVVRSVPEALDALARLREDARAASAEREVIDATR